MRLFATAVVGVTFFAFGSAAAQTAGPHPYDLDRYKPSEAALLRNYGDTLVAQTPLLELRHLDPYKPSHAALLQQIGGGLPLWGVAWFPFAAPVPVAAESRWAPTLFPVDEPPSVAPIPETAPCGCDEPAATPEPSSIATLLRPDSNDGVWITYDGRRWVSGGRSVPLVDTEFERVGAYGAFPVYTRAGSAEDVIYIPTREGSLAQYRLKSESR
jgi:hypothetical protein